MRDIQHETPKRQPALRLSAALALLVCSGPALGQREAPAEAATLWGQILDERQLSFADLSGTSSLYGDLMRASGDTLMVGQVDFPGFVDFYEREHGAWSLKDTVAPSLPGAVFGRGGDISGDLAVIVDAPFSGAGTRRVYTFVRSGSDWLEESSAVVESEVVALDGDTLAVGSAGASGSNRILVFVRNGSGWSLQAQIPTTEATDSMDLDGDLLVVGASGDDLLGTDAGAVWVYERTGSTWAETAVLRASDGQTEQGFGTHVDHEDGWIFAGNYVTNDPFGIGPNAIYAFERSGSTWTEQQKLAGFITDGFGTHSAASGSLLAIGKPGDWLSAPGDVELYALQGGQWVFETWVRDQAPFNYLNLDYGRQVVFADHQLLISSPRAFVDLNNSGLFYVFDVGSQNYCQAGTSASGCQATLAAQGLASSTDATGFTISAAGVEGAKIGLFYTGTNGQQSAPWGSSSSFQCVVPPVQRYGALTPNGTPGACDGLYTVDLHAEWTANPNKNPGSGAIAQAQFWYRDPLSTSNQTTGLSDGVSFFVGP